VLPAPNPVTHCPLFPHAAHPPVPVLQIGLVELTPLQRTSSACWLPPELQPTHAPVLLWQIGVSVWAVWQAVTGSEESVQGRHAPLLQSGLFTFAARHPLLLLHAAHAPEVVLQSGFAGLTAAQSASF